MNDDDRKWITNALAWKAHTNEETSYLIQGLVREMSERGYTSVGKCGWISRGTRTDGRSLPQGGWNPGFFASAFQPTNRPPDKNLWFAGVAICFYDLERKPVKPIVIQGLVKGMQHQQTQWKEDWLPLIFFNHSKLFSYTGDGSTFPDPPSMDPVAKNRVFRFYASLTDGAYFWPKEGWMKIGCLFEIDGYKAVREMAAFLDQLWKDKLDNMRRDKGS